MKKLQTFAKWFGFYVSCKNFTFEKIPKNHQFIMQPDLRKIILETEPLDKFSWILYSKYVKRT